MLKSYDDYSELMVEESTVKTAVDTIVEAHRIAEGPAHFRLLLWAVINILLDTSDDGTTRREAEKRLA